MQARKSSALVPIRVEFETDTHRVRDCFVWNLNEDLIQPEAFARTFCQDLDLPTNTWTELIANQIRAQLEDHEGVAAMDFDVVDPYSPGEEEVPECRVILSVRSLLSEFATSPNTLLQIDVQIATYHLLDHIEWDLLSPLTPEQFALTLCADLGLSGEAVPLVAHAVHEELIKHKRDAIEWGVIGTEPHAPVPDDPDRPRDRSGLSLLKDKTGLGLGWGRTPKDGRGPKPLRSVWRDWEEAEQFRTRFEVLSAEEVERREIERERASRCVGSHRRRNLAVLTLLTDGCGERRQNSRAADEGDETSFSPTRPSQCILCSLYFLVIHLFLQPHSLFVIHETPGKAPGTILTR